MPAEVQSGEKEKKKGSIKGICIEEQNGNLFLMLSNNEKFRLGGASREDYKGDSLLSLVHKLQEELSFSANESVNWANEIRKRFPNDRPAAFKNGEIGRDESSEELEEEDEEGIIRKSFLENDGFLFEQVLGGKYVKYKGDGNYTFVTRVVNDGGIYLPCIGEEISLDEPIVLLPEYPTDYGSIEALFNEVKAFIHEWLDVSPEFEQFASWYVLLTHLYDRMHTINYLSALGDTGTGKTRLLQTIGRICYKPIWASGGVTVAAVKRIADKWRGTIVVDEGDFSKSNEKNELTKWFNLGFEKNQVIFNCNKEDPTILEFYNPYCPKIIARRKQFNDVALEARCLTHVMRQTTRRDIPDQPTEKFFLKQRELRNKLLKFRLDYFYKIDIETAMNVDMGTVEPRIRQAMRAFIPLVSTSPKALADFKKFIVKYNRNVIEERATSFDGAIINAIIDFICDGTLIITSTDIKDKLIADGLDKTTSRTIGRHLAALDLKCLPRRIEGVKKRIVPLGQKLVEVVRRYCIDTEQLDKIIAACLGKQISLAEVETKTKIESKTNSEEDEIGVEVEKEYLF